MILYLPKIDVLVVEQALKEYRVRSNRTGDREVVSRCDKILDRMDKCKKLQNEGGSKK